MLKPGIGGRKAAAKRVQKQEDTEGRKQPLIAAAVQLAAGALKLERKLKAEG